MMAFLLLVPDLFLLTLTAFHTDRDGLLLDSQTSDVFHRMSQDALIALMVVKRRDVGDAWSDSR